jgi:hypothetical protein
MTRLRTGVLLTSLDPTRMPIPVTGTATSTFAATSTFKLGNQMLFDEIAKRSPLR